jgi:hypothetical protein
MVIRAIGVPSVTILVWSAVAARWLDSRRSARARPSDRWTLCVRPYLMAKSAYRTKLNETIARAVRTAPRTWMDRRSEVAARLYRPS